MNPRDLHKRILKTLIASIIFIGGTGHAQQVMDTNGLGYANNYYGNSIPHYGNYGYTYDPMNGYRLLTLLTITMVMADPTGIMDNRMLNPEDIVTIILLEKEVLIIQTTSLPASLLTKALALGRDQTEAIRVLLAEYIRPITLIIQSILIPIYSHIRANRPLA